MIELSEVRSRTMRAVKSKDTGIERLVRSLTHRLGIRCRFNREELPGKPDLAFPSRNKVVFVHGCFWHGHDCKRGARIPKTNRAYWVRKIGRNVERDAENMKRLRSAGWKVLVIWECETGDPANIERRLARFLGTAVQAARPRIRPH